MVSSERPGDLCVRDVWPARDGREETPTCTNFLTPGAVTIFIEFFRRTILDVILKPHPMTLPVATTEPPSARPSTTSTQQSASNGSHSIDDIAEERASRQVRYQDELYDLSDYLILIGRCWADRNPGQYSEM